MLCNCFGPVLFQVPLSDALRLKRSKKLLKYISDGWNINNKGYYLEHIVFNLYENNKKQLIPIDKDKEKEKEIIVIKKDENIEKELLYYKNEYEHFKELCIKQHIELEKSMNIIQQNNLQRFENINN